MKKNDEEVKELKKLIEKMKCCGMCGHFHHCSFVCSLDVYDEYHIKRELGYVGPSNPLPNFERACDNFKLVSLLWHDDIDLNN